MITLAFFYTFFLKFCVYSTSYINIYVQKKNPCKITGSANRVKYRQMNNNDGSDGITKENVMHIEEKTFIAIGM